MMIGRFMNRVRVAGWLAGCLMGCLTLSGGCSAGLLEPAPRSHPRSKPRPEIFDQEVVNLTVDYRRRTIRVEPDSVRIYLQWDEKTQKPLLPIQARWVVKGLKQNHVIYIVAKEDAPDVRFDFPVRFEEQPAFYIDGANNSIASGEVLSIPGLAKDKGYSNPKARYDQDEPYKVVWPYYVVVTDGRGGKELFRVDPEIVVHGHP